MQTSDPISGKTTGRSPVVLAIHGSASSGRQWKALTDQLDGAAHVIAPDLPGYGQATGCNADRRAVLGHIIMAQPAQIHLVAHSFGGAIALRLAHAHPDRIASVTLYDPVISERDDAGRHRLPGPLDSVWRQHADGPALVLMQAFYDYWATDTKWADLSARQRDRLTSHHPGLCRDMKEFTAGDWAIPQHLYRGPVKIFCGQLSPVVTAAMASRIARDHADASVSVLPGLGHFAPLSHPDAVNAHVLSALSKNGVALKRDPQPVLDRVA